MLKVALENLISELEVMRPFITMVASTVLELKYLDLHPWQVSISSTHLHKLGWLEALTQAGLFPTRPWFVPPSMFHLTPSTAGL